MKTIDLKGQIREELGKKSAAASRNAGQIPCVLYGGNDVVHFTLDERDIVKLTHTKDVYQVNLGMGDKTYRAFLKASEYHPVTDAPLHIDFKELVDGNHVTIALPVLLEGSSIGVKNGGVLRRNAKNLQVKALPENLPDAINIDISELKIGESIKVAELPTEKFEFAESAGRVVVAVKTSRRAVVDEEEGEEGEEGAEAEGGDAAAEGDA